MKQRNTYEYQTIRALKRKYYLISLRGGKCQKCGYDKNLSSFDFHHKDPKTKKFKLDQRSLSNRSMKIILEEFEKCLVYCANCHREEHFPLLSMDIVEDRIKTLDDEKNEWLEIKKEKKYVCEVCGDEISKWGKKCKNCLYKSRRKVDRPNIDDLLNEINNNGYSKTAKKYGVSDKTIKKWLTYYEKNDPNANG